MNLINWLYVGTFFLWLMLVIFYAYVKPATGTTLLSWAGSALASFAPLAFFMDNRYRD